METNGYFEYALITILCSLFIVGLSSLVIDTIIMHKTFSKISTKKNKVSNTKNDIVFEYDYVNNSVITRE
jgi:hypothetical protein